MVVGQRKLKNLRGREEEKEKKENEMSEWLVGNWEYILLGFMVLEKVVKLSPSKKDDILFDSIIKPIFNMFAPKK